MKAIILIILAGLVCQASARIGETREQLIARYGPPTHPGTAATLFFEKSGLSVSADMMSGTCQKLIVTNRNGADGKPKEFEPDEIKALLQANGKGSLWDSDGEFKGNFFFKTKDAGVSAVLMTSCLVIQTSAYKAAQDAKADQKIAEDLSKEAGLGGF